MPDNAARRREMLREVYLKTGGDPQAGVSLTELMKAMKIESIAEVGKIARQLHESKMVDLSLTTIDGNGRVRMTIGGIEESERLEKPMRERWASEHPFLWPIIAAVVVMAMGKMFDMAISKPTQIIVQPAPPTPVHNIIQIPETKK